LNTLYPPPSIPIICRLLFLWYPRSLACFIHIFLVFFLCLCLVDLIPSLYL
jgi:hypothetical protein